MQKEGRILTGGDDENRSQVHGERWSSYQKHKRWTRIYYCIIWSRDSNLNKSHQVEGGSGTSGPTQIPWSLGILTVRGRGKYDYRLRKIDMPSFDCTDPDRWILQVERYIAIYQLIDKEKMEASILSINEYVLPWFWWSTGHNECVTSVELKSIFLKRFGKPQGPPVQDFEN